MSFSEVRIKAFTAQELCNACGSLDGCIDLVNNVMPTDVMAPDTFKDSRTESGNEFGAGDGVSSGDVFGGRNESEPDTMGGNETTHDESGDEEGDDGDVQKDDAHEDVDADDERVDDDIEVMVLKFGCERVGA